MKIILGAALSRVPLVPGSVWSRLHRIVGLQRLGHEVVFVEELKPGQCVDAGGKPCPYADSANRELFATTLQRFGLLEHACQIYNRGEATCGWPLARLVRFSKDADLLLNMSGHVATEPILGNCRRRAFLDEDPVYTQLWHAAYGASLSFDRHEVFFSVGQNIGTPNSPIPDCGRTWHHFLPPVIPDFWDPAGDADGGPFTTVAALGTFGDLCYEGQWYRSKTDEFRRFAPLPEQTGQPFEVALRPVSGDSGVVELLRRHQWVVSDGARLTDLEGYQQFIRNSRAEIGIAQHAYVHGRSGWFSDRSAQYLASGKPVLAQSTGLEQRLPTGAGFLTFNNLEEAVAGVAAINADYARHCRAARAFAAEHLDYRRVLPPLLARATG